MALGLELEMPRLADLSRNFVVGGILPNRHIVIGRLGNLQQQRRHRSLDRLGGFLRFLHARFHFASMFAARMIGVHRAISLFTSAARGLGPRLALSGMSLPRSSRRLRTP